MRESIRALNVLEMKNVQISLSYLSKISKVLQVKSSTEVEGSPKTGLLLSVFDWGSFFSPQLTKHLECPFLMVIDETENFLKSDMTSLIPIASTEELRLVPLPLPPRFLSSHFCDYPKIKQFASRTVI